VIVVGFDVYLICYGIGHDERNGTAPWWRVTPRA
jgi:hypothetical protein